MFETDDAARKAEKIRQGQDWRWYPGEMPYLERRTLRHRPYRTAGLGRDHAHCAFCWRKVMDDEDPANKPELFANGVVAAVGYATVAVEGEREGAYWICEGCFEDFAPVFHWHVIDRNGGEGGER